MRLKGILILLVFSLYAQQPRVEEQSNHTVPKKGLVVFSLNDFTNGGKLYAEYIPKEFVRKLKAGSQITVSYEVIKEEINTADTGKLLSYLEKYHTKAILFGRILAVDDLIRLELHVFNGEKTVSKTLEASTKGGVLPALDDLVSRSLSWLTMYADEVLPDLNWEAQTKWGKFLQQLQATSWGFLFRHKWFLAIVLVIATFFLSWLLMFLYSGIFRTVTGKTKTDIDDKILEATRQPVYWVVNLLGLKIAVLILSLPASFRESLNAVLTGGIIWFTTILAARVSMILLEHWGKKITDRVQSRINDDLVPLFVKMSRIGLYILGGLLILSNFGVQIAPLLASLGVAGFALGFAVKDSLANIIGGIILILDESFAVGDKVTIDGDTGIILEVGLRNTKLRTFDNEIIVIPNGELMNKKFKNYALPDPQLRVVVPFSVAYGSDVDFVKKVVHDVLDSKLQNIQKDPKPVVEFIGMGDSALEFQVKFWVYEYKDEYGKKLEALHLIHDALVENKLEIPFPTRTVYLRREE